MSLRLVLPRIATLLVILPVRADRTSGHPWAHGTHRFSPSC